MPLVLAPLKVGLKASLAEYGLLEDILLAVDIFLPCVMKKLRCSFISVLAVADES